MKTHCTSHIALNILFVGMVPYSDIIVKLRDVFVTSSLKHFDEKLLALRR